MIRNELPQKVFKKFVVAYQFAELTRVFVPGKPFQPSLMFWVRPELQVLTYRVGSYPNRQTFN
jgi:hypothetical protein